MTNDTSPLGDDMSDEQSVRRRPEAKVLRQFRLSEEEDALLVQLQQRRGDRTLIDTQRALLALVPGLLSGEHGADPPEMDDADQIAGRWQVVVDVLDGAATAWRDVSPESAGPVTELCADARWNLIFWRARGHGANDNEARGVADQELGHPVARHIMYDPVEGDEASE